MGFNRERFLAPIASFTAKGKAKPTIILRKVLFDMSSGVVVMTPVDSGRARGNWQFGAGSIPSGVIAGAGAGDSMPRLQAGIAEANADGKIYYVVNNLPYIHKLENGGYPNPPKHDGGKTASGYSTQAPQGMVRVTIIRFQESATRANAA